MARRRKHIDLPDAIRRELAAAFGQMGEARAKASYKDLAAVAGVLIDRLAALEAVPNGSSPPGAGDAREQLARELARLADGSEE